MEYPRLEHTGQNKKERPEQSDNKMRRKQSLRTGLDHPGRNKRQGPPPPRTAASGDKWLPDALDDCIRDGTRSRAPPDWIIRGQAAAERHGLDHPGWIKQHEPPHPGLDQPVRQWGKQEAEAEVKVSSSHENKATEKRSGSQNEQPVVMQ